MLGALGTSKSGSKTLCGMWFHISFSMTLLLTIKQDHVDDIFPNNNIIYNKKIIVVITIEKKLGRESSLTN